jgi:hypothetical protein
MTCSTVSRDPKAGVLFAVFANLPLIQVIHPEIEVALIERHAIEIAKSPQPPLRVLILEFFGLARLHRLESCLVIPLLDHDEVAIS